MKQVLKDVIDKLSDSIGYEEFLDGLCEKVEYDYELEVPKWLRV